MLKPSEFSLPKREKKGREERGGREGGKGGRKIHLRNLQRDTTSDRGNFLGKNYFIIISIPKRIGRKALKEPWRVTLKCSR